MDGSVRILPLFHRMARVVLPRRIVATLLVALLQVGSGAAGQSSQAKTFTIFDRTFVRTTGAPVPQAVSVAAPSPGNYELRIESDGTASAVVSINGTDVVGPND